MTDQTVYKEFILALYRHPLNKKVLTFVTHEQHEHNSSCGDDITLQLHIDEHDTIIDVGFQGDGCAISQAAVSLLTDDIKGKTKQQATQIQEEDMFDLLTIPISYSRKKCALLGLKALHGALKK